ncbi:MAG: hypothetical protein Q8R54_03420, partial [Methylobacter sp.]|nr:hypothetical protein [Methylobacter sp.]
KSCTELKNCKNAHPSAPPNNKKIGLLIQTSPIWIICLAYFFSHKCQVYLKKLYRFAKCCIAFDIRLCRLICPCRTIRREQIIGTQLTAYLVPQLLGLLVVVPTLFVVHAEILLGDDGEPFFWNAGISVWPSEIIRLFAGILGCLFIVNTINELGQNKRQLAREFCLQLSLTKPQRNVIFFWENYSDKISSRKLLNKALMFSVIFFCFSGLLIWTFGVPFVPFRGEASWFANILVLGFSVPVFIFLVMTVFVATGYSIKMITQLDKCHSIWPETTLHHFDLILQKKIAPVAKATSTETETLITLQNKLKKNKKYHLDEWLDIKFIATHTEVVGTLVYYPFIILALMIFARSKIFDNWDIPICLVLIFLSAAVITLGSAFYLRRVAARARQNTIKKISSMKIALACQPDPDSPACKTMGKQIDLALAQIQEIKEGAFQPLTHEPAFQAFLIPFGSFGGVALLENLVLNGFL